MRPYDWRMTFTEWALVKRNSLCSLYVWKTVHNISSLGNMLDRGEKSEEAHISLHKQNLQKSEKSRQKSN